MFTPAIVFSSTLVQVPVSLSRELRVFVHVGDQNRHPDRVVRHLVSGANVVLAVAD